MIPQNVTDLYERSTAGKSMRLKITNIIFGFLKRVFKDYKYLIIFKSKTFKKTAEVFSS